MGEILSTADRKNRALREALDALDEHGRNDPSRINSEHAHYDTLFDAGYFDEGVPDTALTQQRMRTLMMNARMYAQIARLNTDENLRLTIAQSDRIRALEGRIATITTMLFVLFGMGMSVALLLWWKGFS